MRSLDKKMRTVSDFKSLVHKGHAPSPASSPRGRPGTRKLARGASQSPSMQSTASTPVTSQAASPVPINQSQYVEEEEQAEGLFEQTNLLPVDDDGMIKVSVSLSPDMIQQINARGHIQLSLQMQDTGLQIEHTDTTLKPTRAACRAGTFEQQPHKSTNIVSSAPGTPPQATAAANADSAAPAQTEPSPAITNMSDDEIIASLAGCATKAYAVANLAASNPSATSCSIDGKSDVLRDDL